MIARRGLIIKSFISIFSYLLILTLIIPFNTYSSSVSSSLDFSGENHLICLTSSDNLCLEKISFRVQLTETPYSPTHIELIIKNQGNETVDSIAFWLNGSFSSFSLNDPFGQLEYSLFQVDQSYLFNISLRNPLSTDQSFLCFIQAQWILAILTNEKPYYNHVEIPIFLPMETELMILELFLPLNNFLIDDHLQINPNDNAFIMENANQTVVSWFIPSPEFTSDLPLVFSAKYTDTSGLEEPPTKDLITDNFLAVLLVLLIGGIAVFSFLKWRSRLEKYDFSRQLLKEDEILLLELLKQEGGKLDQRDLQELCEFSRSKLSRHLFLLEEKGLIEKVQFGRTNRILLTEEALSNLTLKEPVDPLKE